jgi:hypothetical protein
MAPRLQNRARMRRAWLLALLAAPAVAAAQTPTPGPGLVTFPAVPQSATDGFINAAECLGGTIALSWRPLFDTGKSFADMAVGGSYQLYASNTVTTGACPTTDADKGIDSLKAAPVGETITANLNETMFDVAYATSVIAGAAGKGACNATANEDIELCVQAKDPGGNAIGVARGKLILSLTKPSAPSLTSASSGEQALNVRWDAPNAGSNESYEAQASVDPNFLATSVIRSSGRVTGTEVRITRLENNVTYTVRVFAFSDADNQSDPSNAVTGIPLPVNDFWEAYQAAGGREEGGCATGTAGLLALAGVASLLALRRRP